MIRIASLMQLGQWCSHRWSRVRLWHPTAGWGRLCFSGWGRQCRDRMFGKPAQGQVRTKSMVWMIVCAWMLGHVPDLAWAGTQPTLGFRFDFGSGAVATGYIPVHPTNAYGSDPGWGFDLDSIVVGYDRGGPTPLLADGVRGMRPFYFSVRVPEGNYRVVVTFGDALAGSTNWVKAESRRVMLGPVVTRPGEFVTAAFTVNVRTAYLPDGRSVRLKPRERDVLHWDDKLTLEFNGAHPAVAALEIVPEPDARTVFLLGDSTVTDQPREPWSSWGQVLPMFFRWGLAVANHAESGESLTSSYRALRVEKVLSQLKPGDYVFVQYGHNDQKERGEGAGPNLNYRTNLIRLVESVRAAGAHPVLVTSMERKAGVTNATHGEYPAAMRRVAGELDVPLIDLNALSVILYRALGTNLDSAFVDGSHHTVYGGYLLARCVVDGIRRAGLDLTNYFIPGLDSFDPATPEPPEAIAIPPSPIRSEVKPDGA